MKFETVNTDFIQLAETAAQANPMAMVATIALVLGVAIHWLSA